MTAGRLDLSNVRPGRISSQLDVPMPNIAPAGSPAIPSEAREAIRSATKRYVVDQLLQGFWCEDEAELGLADA